jgi:hypothetical protein
VFKAEAKKPDIKSWWQQIAQWRARNSLYYKKSSDVILPQHAIQSLFEATRGKDTYITTEVGQHQMWAAQFYGFEEPHRWMTSGGLGTMGYGLPAAIGVQVAHPDSLVIDIAGDASVQMTMQEMSTGGPVRAADQDLHPEQPVHGHGAAVAAAAARQPAVAFLFGGAAMTSSSWRKPMAASVSRSPSPLISTAPSRR